MADLFEIGKSGVQAYRRALGVTGQNIANANTEGYNRRDANLSEVSATQGDILSVSDQAGLGVRVESIRRAFDDLIVTKSNVVNSSYENARATNEKLKSVERLLLPGDYSVSSYLQNFFDGLNNVHQAPTDLGARQLVIEYGELLTDGIVSLAKDLEKLKSDLKDEAKAVSEMVNVTVDGLAGIQKKLISSGGSGAASNALLDQRDLLIQELSGYVGVSVEYQERGAVQVSLGPNLGREKLIDLFEVQKLIVDDTNEHLSFALMQGSNHSATNQVTNGYLAGLQKASVAIDETLKQLDHLALELISDFNDVHKSGLTLEGKSGSDLFSVSQFELGTEQNNSSDFDVSVREHDLSVARELFYSKASNSLIDAGSGEAFHFEDSSVTVDGALLHFSGDPADGDTIYIKPVSNIAKSLEFVVEQPEGIAAASSFTINKNTANVGAADIVASKDMTVNRAELATVKEIFNNDLNPATSQSFRSSLTATLIEPSIENIEILVTEKQSSTRFVLSEGEITSLRSKNLNFDGINFPLSGDTQAPWSSLEELTKGLNDGSIRGTTDGNTSVSLGELGLIAATNGSTISFTQKKSNDPPFTSAILGSSKSTFSSPPLSTGEVFIFSRNGRQVSGPALSETQIQEFLTTKNGFFEDAEYRADYLESGYLGVALESKKQGKSYSFSIPTSGMNSGRTSEQYFSSNVSSSLNRKGFDLWIGDVTNNAPRQLVSIDPGLISADSAQQIDETLSNVGIFATATNKLRASIDSNYPTTLNFGLKNTDGTYSDITARLDSKDLSTIVTQINLFSGKTGVVAEISNDNASFTLEHLDGDDIIISDLKFLGSGGNGAGKLDLQKLTRSGSLIDGAFLALSQDNSSVRVSGEINLQSTSNFAASLASYASQTVPEFSNASLSRHSSFISENTSKSGDSTSLVFDFNTDIFQNSTNPFTANGHIDDTHLKLEINKVETNVNIGELSDRSSRGIAMEIVKDYRQSSQISLLAEIEYPGPNLNSEELLEFNFEGKTYQGILNLPDGDIDNLSRASIQWDGNGDNRFSYSLVAKENGYVLSFGALDGVPTAEVMEFENINSSAILTQTLTWTDLNSSNVQTVTIDGVQRTENQSGDLEIFRDKFASNNVRAFASDAGLELSDFEGDFIDTNSILSSNANSHTVLKNMPNEELIVLFNNANSSNFSVKFEETSSNESLARDLIVKSIDSNLGLVEILDRDTRQSLATRVVDEDGTFNALGFNFEISGGLISDDEFEVVHSSLAEANSDNIMALLSLSEYNIGNGTGEFNQVFKEMVSSLGLEVKSSQITLDASNTAKQAILQLKDEFSGVNLDTEAANLMEQQQAYQALARVLSTARDLLNTLMEVM